MNTLKNLTGLSSLFLTLLKLISRFSVLLEHLSKAYYQNTTHQQYQLPLQVYNKFSKQLTNYRFYRHWSVVIVLSPFLLIGTTLACLRHCEKVFIYTHIIQEGQKSTMYTALNLSIDDFKP